MATLSRAPATPSAKRVVVLAGPTAVGKSALGLRLCEQLQGELISVDSVQVYRGLEIGANKASSAERGRVPHHLLDIREPLDEYTAGSFFRDALRAIEDVHKRGRLPVLVGGTSMYLRWLVRGRPTAPRADPAVAQRAQAMLEPHLESGDWAGGLAVLSERDEARAAQLLPNDWYRLHRALVVAMQTESDAASLPPQEDTEGLDALRGSLDLRCFFLAARREPLCRRIDARCDAMLRAGLIEEVADQLATKRLLPSCPAGRAIGYRQTIEYVLRTPYKAGDAEALRGFVEGFAAVSRRYAAQQTKWFRNEPAFEWVDASGGAAATEAHVLRSIARGRTEHEAALAHPAQAELRRVRPEEGKAMRTYVGQHEVLSNPDALAQLQTRADACCARLQPLLEELAEADAAHAAKYPYHASLKRKRAGGGAKSDAADDAQGLGSRGRTAAGSGPS